MNVENTPEMPADSGAQALNEAQQQMEATSAAAHRFRALFTGSMLLAAAAIGTAPIELVAMGDTSSSIIIADVDVAVASSLVLTGTWSAFQWIKQKNNLNTASRITDIYTRQQKLVADIDKIKNEALLQISFAKGVIQLPDSSNPKKPEQN